MKKTYLSPESFCAPVVMEQLLAQSLVDGSGIDYGDPIVVPGSDIF